MRISTNDKNTLDRNPGDGTMNSSSVTAFLLSPHCRIYRHILLQVAVLLITINVFWYEPLQTVSFWRRLGGCLAYFLSMDAVIYTNLHVLVPRFLLKNRLGSYVLAAIITNLVVITFLSVTQGLLFEVILPVRMHVDMDAFFASIEQLDHPEYKGHPVIVGGLSSRGVVATCSYEARKFGVHSAMPISRAKKLCPDGIYVYPRMDRYKEVSNQIFSIMKEFTPYIEPLSIDEAFLEVSGMSTMYSGPKALGRAIKDRVFEKTGLIISAGLAPNKFLAKLASDLDKPDGLVVIPYGREKEVLAPLPIKRIWGVGPRTEKILKAGGFHLMRHIQSLPDESSLIPLVGNQAKRIWELANGIDDRPVETERKIQSIGVEETYEEDLTEGRAIELEFRYFANRLS